MAYVNIGSMISKCLSWPTKLTVWSSTVIEENWGLRIQRFLLQENSNESSQPQSVEFSYSETVSNTSTFTHQWGISISRSAKFSCELPTVFKGEISTTTTGSVSLTWGKTETFQKTVSGKHPVVAAPFTKVICEVVANEAMMDVPYTMYFKSGKTSGGMWKGVSTWDVKTSLKEEKLNPPTMK